MSAFSHAAASARAKSRSSGGKCTAACVLAILVEIGRNGSMDRDAGWFFCLSVSGRIFIMFLPNLYIDENMGRI